MRTEQIYFNYQCASTIRIVLLYLFYQCASTINIPRYIAHYQRRLVEREYKSISGHFKSRSFEPTHSSIFSQDAVFKYVGMPFQLASGIGNIGISKNILRPTSLLLSMHTHLASRAGTPQAQSYLFPRSCNVSISHESGLLNWLS